MPLLSLRLIGVAAFALIFASALAAQSTSPGCAALNNPAFDGLYNLENITPHDFYAGETIRISNAEDLNFFVSVLGVPLGSVASPLIYTFSADSVGSVAWGDVGPLNYTVSCTPVGGSGDDDAGEPCPAALDGRINTDCAPPVALYDEGNYFALYGVDPVTGQGELIFRLLKTDIGDTPAENSLLETGVHPFTGHPVSVWSLTTDALQVNATYADSKAYIFTFDADGSLIGYVAA